MKRLLTYSKKNLCLLLALILTAAFIPAVYAAEPEDALIKGTFTMTTFDGFDPGEQTYYYSDSYFTASGKESNEHLRTMSAALVFPVRGSSDTPAETFGAILSEIGFQDITTYDLEHTSLDTMGMILAHKSVHGKEVVAVVLRGDKYEHEMAANMIAGTEGDIQAFADAEALVESRVSAYLAEHGIASAKYWVTSYSRSGAVANLFGRELNKTPERFYTSADDIYVYTFETVKGSADDTVYENIHQIIDRRDLISYVYPGEWGLNNNGVTEYIGTTDDMVMLKKFDLFSENRMADYQEMNLVDYLNELDSFLSQNLSRETFAEKLGLPLSRVLNIYFDLDETQRAKVLPFFQQTFNDMMNDFRTSSTLFAALLNPDSQENIDNLYALIVNYLDKNAEEIGNPFDDESYEIVKASLRTMLEPLLPLIKADFFATIDKGDGNEPENVPLYHFLTLVGNLQYIIKNHFNYNVFNELKALDSYYSERKDDVLRGDADGDGKITISDATMIQEYIADYDMPDPFQIRACDVNGDGSINISDTTEIQRFLADCGNPYHIGESVAVKD